MAGRLVSTIMEDREALRREAARERQEHRGAHSGMSAGIGVQCRPQRIAAPQQFAVSTQQTDKLFEAPVKVEQEDETSRLIKTVLGDYYSLSTQAVSTLSASSNSAPSSHNYNSNAHGVTARRSQQQNALPHSENRSQRPTNGVPSPARGQQAAVPQKPKEQQVPVQAAPATNSNYSKPLVTAAARKSHTAAEHAIASHRAAPETKKSSSTLQSTNKTSIHNNNNSNSMNNNSARLPDVHVRIEEVLKEMRVPPIIPPIEESDRIREARKREERETVEKSKMNVSSHQTTSMKVISSPQVAELAASGDVFGANQMSYGAMPQLPTELPPIPLSPMHTSPPRVVPPTNDDPVPVQTFPANNDVRRQNADPVVHNVDDGSSSSSGEDDDDDEPDSPSQDESQDSDAEPKNMRMDSSFHQPFVEKSPQKTNAFGESAPSLYPQRASHARPDAPDELPASSPQPDDPNARKHKKSWGLATFLKVATPTSTPVKSPVKHSPRQSPEAVKAPHPHKTDGKSHKKRKQHDALPSPDEKKTNQVRNSRNSVTPDPERVKEKKADWPKNEASPVVLNHDTNGVAVESRLRPEETRTRPEESRTRSEEPRGRPEEPRPRLEEPRARPEEVRHRSEDRLRPEESRLRPEDSRVRPEDSRPRPEEGKRKRDDKQPQRPDELTVKIPFARLKRKPQPMKKCDTPITLNHKEPDRSDRIVEARTPDVPVTTTPIKELKDGHIRNNGSTLADDPRRADSPMSVESVSSSSSRRQWHSPEVDDSRRRRKEEERRKRLEKVDKRTMDKQERKEIPELPKSVEKAPQREKKIEDKRKNDTKEEPSKRLKDDIPKPERKVDKPREDKRDETVKPREEKRKTDARDGRKDRFQRGVMLSDAAEEHEKDLKVMNGDRFISEARKLKHDGDNRDRSMSYQVRKYLESSLCYMLGGHIMESSNRAESIPQVIKMYQDTQALVRHIITQKLMKLPQGATHDRLTVLALRVQAALSHRIFLAINRDKEFKDKSTAALNEFLSMDIAKILGNSDHSSTNGSTVSPAGSHSSASSLLHAIDGRDNGSRHDNSSQPGGRPTVSVPVNVLEMAQKMLQRYSHFHRAYELWNQSTTRINESNNRDFFDAVASATSGGHSPDFTVPTAEFVKYVREAICRIEKYQLVP